MNIPWDKDSSLFQLHELVYLFFSGGYTRKTQGNALGSSFSLSWERVEAKHRQQKYLRKSNLGPLTNMSS